MILIRLASLFEEEGFHTFVSPVTPTERCAIATMGTIASHAGYREMDDVTLWRTLTTDIPELLTRLRGSGTA